MRILDLNNFYTETGGGVKTYHNRKREHFGRVATHRNILMVPSDRWAARVEPGFTRVEVPALALGTSGYRLCAEPGVVRDLIRWSQPDLIEIGSPYVLPTLAHRACRALGIRVPTVGFYHADYPHAYVQAGTRSLGPAASRVATDLALDHMGRLYGSMTATFAASDYALAKLHARGVRRLFHTPLGVDVEVFHPSARDGAVRRQLGIPEDAPLCLFLGRLAGMKRVDLLLEAWPQLRRNGERHLLVVGHGPLEPAVADLAARFPEVHRLPYLSDRDAVAAAYATADIYLSLGEWETFSLTTLEAIASGTPVVAADGGAAGELARRFGASGTFTPGDAATLCAAVDRVLALPRDRVATHLSRVAARHFTWTAAFDRIQGWYDRIVDAARARDLESLAPADARWHTSGDLPAVRDTVPHLPTGP